MSKKQPTWESDPILNFLTIADDRTRAELYEKIPLVHHRDRFEETPIERHRRLLGPWHRTFTSEFRYRVWETDRWRVYVSNKKGVGFEVHCLVPAKEALAALDDYLFRMNLLAHHCRGTKWLCMP